jgi:hypothetical protein
MQNGGRRGGGPRMQRMARKAEKARIAAMTPAQRAALEAQKAKAAIFAARKKENSFTYLPARTGWSVVKPGPLTPIGKEFQKMVLARDWDALFNFLPVKYWGKRDTLGKYSFTDKNGVRTWIPFSEGDIRSFVFSPYYTVQPGWTCTDAQRELGVAANLKAMNRHGQKFRNTDPRRMWPIFPGWGHEDSGQRYGCEKGKKSLWVKIRKVVVGAAIVVAAVYLGPVIVAKVKSVAGAAAGGTSAATTTAATTAATTGATTAATSGIAATGITASSIGAGTQTLLGYVNKARTINAIVKGKLPPPPISIQGSSFREWALIVAKQKIQDEAIDYAMEKGQEYIIKKMTAKEEALLKAEIAEMQRRLIALTPPEVLKMPPDPDPELATPIKRIQVIEEKRAADLQKFIIPGAIVAGALILGG